MESRLVADGAKRFESSKEHQDRLRKLRESIEARYAKEMPLAGWWDRLLLKWRISVDFRRERKKIVPSSQSLYASVRTK